MRKFGLVLLCAGVLAFFHASGRVSELDPVPEGVSLSDSLRYYDAGKWEMARYGAAGVALIGLLFLFFPEGR